MAKATPKEKDLGKYFKNPLPDKCDSCGLKYDKFETGENYQSVYDTLWKSSEDRSQWLNKGRHTVLTVLWRWHELKQGLWQDHLEMCEGGDEEIEPWAADRERIEEY